MRLVQQASAVSVLAAMIAIGCQNGGASSGDGHPAASSKPAPTTAAAAATGSAATLPAADKPTAEPTAKADEAPKNPAADFFTGESPADVKLITGFVQSYKDFEYAIKTPEGWKGGSVSGWEYMSMRKDSTAALFCDAMGNDESFSLGSLVEFKQIQSLAKRAPIMGKDLKEDGPPVVAKVGKLAYPARVGHATGNLFGEDGGDVYWIDIRHQQKEGPWHMYCLMGIKKSAGDDVRTEAKAIMRSLEPPRGKKVLEPKMD